MTPVFQHGAPLVMFLISKYDSHVSPFHPRNDRNGNRFNSVCVWHDDVIKWNHFPRNWPFVRGIHRSRWLPRTKGQWRGALMFSLICTWINDWVNSREADDLRRHRGHYDVSVMVLIKVDIYHGADVLIIIWANLDSPYNYIGALCLIKLSN